MWRKSYSYFKGGRSAGGEGDFYYKADVTLGEFPMRFCKRLRSLYANSP